MTDPFDLNRFVQAQEAVYPGVVRELAQGRRVLFGRYGVTGVVNVDLTLDFVARLGAAFGTVLPRGSKVTIRKLSSIATTPPAASPAQK